MIYLLWINTPDGNGETCEEHLSVESMQIKKDQIYSMPWTTKDGLDVYACDLDGNEVYLK